MNNEKKLKYIRNLNERYIENSCNGIAKGDTNFEIIYGNIPILLSAPHAVRQNRNGKEKGADTLTGPIVEFLCERTGTNGITRTFNLQDDPNSQNFGHGLEYKKAILRLIQQLNIACVIDIHGCKDNYPFDIDIGTNNGVNIGDKKFLNTICKNFATIGKTTIDNKFRASHKEVICNYISMKSNIPCFQIELSTSMRTNPSKLLQLLNKFEIIIGELSKQIELERKADNE